MLSELHDVEDLLPEGEDCEEASKEESDEERNSNGLVEARPLGTICGRIVFRPNRLDLTLWEFVFSRWNETTDGYQDSNYQTSSVYRSNCMFLF